MAHQIITNHDINDGDNPDGFGRWVARDHENKLHLIASTGKIHPTPESKYSADTLVADVIVVFDPQTGEPQTFTDCWVSQVWLRRRLTNGGILVGRLERKALGDTTNLAWVLTTVNATHGDHITKWAEANLFGSPADKFWLSPEYTPTPPTNHNAHNSDTPPPF